MHREDVCAGAVGALRQPLVWFGSDIFAKAERRAYGEAHRPVTILQQIVEEVPVDEVALHAQAEMVRDVPVKPSAEAVETLPVDFAPGRNELLDHLRRKRVGGMGR